TSAPRTRPLPDRPPSFDEVYALHGAFVYRNLRRLGVAESSLDDAFQDVFVVVHRRPAEFEHRSQLTTWLFAIVLGVARNQRRTRRRHPLEARDGDDATALVDLASEPPDRCAERAQARELLLALLETLDD